MKDNTKIRKKLKDLGIRLTEMSEYFNISRPTLYKYIENFESGNIEQIPNSIRNVFLYTMQKTVISKKEVINYIINLFVRDLIFNEQDLLLNEVHEKLKKSASNETLKFILNWLDHPEYTKFMINFNAFERLLKSKSNIDKQIVEDNYTFYSMIYDLDNPENKNSKKIEKIIKYLNNRRVEQWSKENLELKISKL